MGKNTPLRWDYIVAGLVVSVEEELIWLALLLTLSVGLRQNLCDSTT